MREPLHIPMITAAAAGIAVVIIFVFFIRAYMDATKRLQWHERKHKSFPWTTKAPQPSRLQRIMNTILLIKTIR
jgi:hypothetical protein